MDERSAARRERGARRPDAKRGIGFLADVARAYYEQDLTQDQVADLFGVSRSQVSRYLREARELDIVQIRIVLPDTRNRDLEQALAARFPHLREVVVPAVFAIEPVTVRRAVARATTALIQRLVRPGSTVCFGAGRTLSEAVAGLRRQGITNVTVCQAMGNAGHAGLDIDYNAIAARAAAAFDGVAWQVNAPAILGPGARAADLEASNRSISESLAMARSADMYVLGIGSMSGDEIYVRTGLITLSELSELSGAGAVGDICGNFYDVAGQPVRGPFHERVVGVGLDDLRRAPVALACASGDEKVAAIAGALNGRYVNALVTDERTAGQLLELAGAAGNEGGER